MKRLTVYLFSAAFAVASFHAGVSTAAAARVHGNWSSQKRTNFSRARAPRPAPPSRSSRRQFDFFGIFNAPGGTRGNLAGTRSPLKPASRLRPVRILPLPEEKPRIYVYPTPRAVALSAPGLTGAVAGDAIASLILDSLRQGVARVRVTPESRKAIVKFYAARHFKPLWTTSGGIRERAFPVIERLARASEEGLDPSLYRLPVVWSVNGELKDLETAPAKLAQLDIELTAMALRYARHASGGVVNPNLLSAYHDLKPPRVGLAPALKKLAEASSPAAWLASLLPRHPAYQIMRVTLKRLGATVHRTPLPAVAYGPVIRPGGIDARLPLIRKHLIRMKLLTPHPATPEPASRAEKALNADARDGRDGAPTPAGDDITKEAANQQPGKTDGPASSPRDANLYGPELEKAVRAFQRRAGLRADGLIGKGTLRALNGRRNASASARARKIALNMERLRWEPRNFGHTHFLINQPAFEAYLVRDGRRVWSTRVIIGKPDKQTAFFNDQMEMVVFNPYWGVPQSIMTREMLPRLMRDPTWLDRKGFELRDKHGQIISSASVDWRAYGGQSKIPFSVRQLPGARNALGHIKFLFPNKHSIYMHDTPARSLFKRKQRAFSHGCVRVQKPLQMAQLVTGLSGRDIKARITEGENERMNLKHKIPVHMAYFTVWPDESGRLHYYADVYGRDRLLATALKKTVQALRAPGRERIARN